jgi:hypothetical protein
MPQHYLSYNCDAFTSEIRLDLLLELLFILESIPGSCGPIPAMR